MDITGCRETQPARLITLGPDAVELEVGTPVREFDELFVRVGDGPSGIARVTKAGEKCIRAVFSAPPSALRDWLKAIREREQG